MEQEFTTNNDDNELTLVPDPFLDVSCPFLGVQNDSSTPMAYPTPNNLCYTFKPARRVDLVKQRRHCLSDGYGECAYFQQQLAKATMAKNGGIQDSRRRPRFLNGRTLALGLMLILILLAVLIWWPPPGTSIEEGTVFGVSINLNALNSNGEAAETTSQTGTVQRESEVNEAVPAAKAGQEKRSNSLEKIIKQDLSLNSPSIDDSDATLEEPDSEPAAIVENVVVEENAESSESATEHTGFTIVSYEDRGSDREMLNVYQVPGSGSYVRIARPELFSLLGRDAAAEWLKIGTESGIEGWVLVSDTELGNWVASLSEIQP